MKQIAAAYIRVSTEEQTEYSPDAQLRAINNYCRHNNLALPKENIFIDAGSGRSTGKRPQFMKMIAAAKASPCPFSVILVHRFDRFARSREDSVVYKSLLNKECGVKVVSITETVENDKISLIMESMLEAMAEYYSINLSEEVKKGMTEKAKRGEIMAVAPFGYKSFNKTIIPDPCESTAVKKIFDSFNSGQSYLQIARELNEAGLVTHRGNLFENRTVEYILRNPVYCGYIRWNPTTKTRRNYDHPDLMVVKGTHEPLIDEETFQTAQQKVAEIKSKYRSGHRSGNGRSHWLVGLVCCSECGKSMVNSNGYFICNSYQRGKCKVRNSIRADVLEQLIVKAVMNDFYSENLTFAELFPADEAQKSETDTIATSVERLNMRLARVRLSYENGIDTIEEYSENKARLQNEIRMLKKRLNSKSTAESYTTDFHGSIKSFFELLFSALDADFKNELAQCFIKEICFCRKSRTVEICYLSQL